MPRPTSLEFCSRKLDCLAVCDKLDFTNGIPMV